MSVKGGDVVFNFKPNDKELQNSIDDMGSSIKKMVTALGLDRLISKTISALNSSLDGAIERVDTLNNFPRVMENLGISAEDSNEAMQELNDGLLGLPTTLNQGVSAVQRFTSQNGDVKKSTQIFLALNNAILAGGASTESQASAMEQLSQAYAKGKPDALEWRSMLTAMPAQLKQVATAMGYTSTAVGGDLYEAIQKGRVSMDDLMDTIIELNTNGVDGFASFSKQAKDSTNGLRTSITNVKTAITRGLANGIDSLNESLKKADLPTINEMIQKLGTIISDVFKKIGTGIKNINWKKITPVIKDVLKYMKNLKTTLLNIAKTVLNTIMPIITNPNILKLIITFKTLNPLIKTAQSLIQGLGGVIKGLSSPIGIITAVIGGLATAITFMTNNLTDEQQELVDLRDKVIDNAESFKEFNKQVDDNMNKSLAQIERIKDLKEELKKLVDENGNVKESDKARVQFILNELNSALGTEYKLNGDIVESYKDIQKEIDKVIEKKKAEIILTAEEEKYRKAIETRTQAYEDMQKLLEKTGMTMDEMKKKIKDIQESDLKGEGFNVLDYKSLEWITTYGNTFMSLEEQIETSTQNMQQYEEDYAKFTEGKFNEIGTNVKKSTTDWTDETAETIQENIEKKETSLQAELEIYKTYGDKKAEAQTTEDLKELANLKSQLQARTNTVSKLSSTEVEAYIRLAQKDRNAYNNIMNQTSGDTKKQLQAIASTIDKNGHIPEEKISTVANNMAWQFESMDSGSWGADMVSGVASGIDSEAYKVEQATKRVASTIFRNLHFSKPDEGVLRNYEKWMPDFVEGLSRTLEQATPSLYNSIRQMAGNIKDQLSMGLSMSPTLNSSPSYSPMVNVTVQNNMETDFMGNLVSNIKTFSNGSKNDYNYGM